MPQKRKYLFVSAPFGGIEVFCKNIQRVVDERDEIDASWIWIEYQPKEFISRIPPLSLNWTVKGGLVARSRVKKLVRAGGQFDAVFFNHTIPATFLSRFRKRVPMILSLDGTPQVLAPYSLWYRGREKKTAGIAASVKRCLIRNIYKDAVHIFAWSNLVRESLINDYEIDPDKISIVPPGIDLRLWTPVSGNTRTSDRRHQPIKILFVGGEFQRKGGDLLLRIAHREEFRNCEFHFVTRAFQGMLGSNCFVHDNVKANSTKLIDLYHKADLFVLPTRADLAPTMAICEAMASGLPVVSTSVGGLEEIVKHGETGYISSSR